MNNTPEHPDTLKTLEESKKKMGAVPFSVFLSMNVENGKSAWNHGDVVNVGICGILPDGSEFDLSFPHNIQICLNLMGSDRQTTEFLTWIVRTWKPEVVFETGTHKGRSAKAICDAMDTNGVGHLITVDRVDHGVESRTSRTTFIEGNLPEVLSEHPRLRELRDIDMAYLDGNHTEEYVKKEYEYVLERASKRGCYVLFDDASSTSYFNISEFVLSLPGAIILPTPHGLGFVHISAPVKS